MNTKSGLIKFSLITIITAFIVFVGFMSGGVLFEKNLEIHSIVFWIGFSLCYFLIIRPARDFWMGKIMTFLNKNEK